MVESHSTAVEWGCWAFLAVQEDPLEVTWTHRVLAEWGDQHQEGERIRAYQEVPSRVEGMEGGTGVSHLVGRAERQAASFREAAIPQTVAAWGI